MMENIVGIDIGKYELEIYRNGQSSTILNNPKALAKWVKAYGEGVELFAFEPTGGYEAKVKQYLSDNKLPYHSIHANKVRAYAKANGQLAKTDKIDAQIIAEYAHCFQLGATQSICEHPRLKALLDRRNQLVDLRKEEKCRLDTAFAKDKIYLSDIKKHIRYLDKSIEYVS